MENQLWKHELIDNVSPNCKHWGIYWSKEGIIAYKEFNMNFECRVAPLEHYHTMLIDEKYQSHNYIDSNKNYFKARGNLINMIMEAGRKLRQSQSIVHLAIKYMDIILNTNNVIQNSVPSESFKVIAMVWLNIASKFDALDLNTPYISELQRATGVYVPYPTLVAYERECLKILDWNLKLVTIYHFIEVIKNQGFILNNDTRNKGECIENDLDQVLRKSAILLDYFSDLVTKDELFLKFKPSHVAAAWVLITRVCLNIDKPWSDTISEILVYEKDDIHQAYMLIEQQYGYLIEAAENILVNMNTLDQNSSTLNSRVNRIESSILHDTKTAQIRLNKRLKVLNGIHDFTDKFEVKPKFSTSEASGNSNLCSDDEDRQIPK